MPVNIERSVLKRQVLCVCVYDLVTASLRDEDVGATAPLGEVIDVLLKGGPIR